MYMLAQPLILHHFWPRVNVIDTIEPTECHSVPQEVIALECRVDPENAVTPSCSLDVMEENGHHWYVSAEKLGQQVLVEPLNLTKMVQP